MARKCRVKFLHHDMCGKVFTKTSHLRRHIHVHSEGMLKNMRHINLTMKSVQIHSFKQLYYKDTFISTAEEFLEMWGMWKGFHWDTSLKSPQPKKHLIGTLWRMCKFILSNYRYTKTHSYPRQVERFHCKMCGNTFTDIKCLAINLTVKNVQIYSYMRLY